jgi:hypothetical protein
MKAIIQWTMWGVLLGIIFIMTLFFRSPEQIHDMLLNVVDQTRPFSLVAHILFVTVFVVGLVRKKIRTVLFTFFIVLLSLSALIIAIAYLILPNIIIFSMFLVFIIHAYFKKKLNFELKSIAGANVFFGIMGLVFGFWYLHWVESPIWLNALFYSPLGIVNCPTMVTICAFLCITRKPRSVFLEATVAGVTLYFGFFGVFLLKAYVDVILIACAMFLLLRLGSYLTFEDTAQKSRVKTS